jgi:hypothetical protein
MGMVKEVRYVENNKVRVALTVIAFLIMGVFYIAPALADSILGNVDLEKDKVLLPCESEENKACPYEEMHGDGEHDDCPHEDHWASGEHDHDGSGCGMMGGDHSGMYGGHMGGHGGHMGGRGAQSGRGMDF